MVKLQSRHLTPISKISLEGLQAWVLETSVLQTLCIIVPVGNFSLHIPHYRLPFLSQILGCIHWGYTFVFYPGNCPQQTCEGEGFVDKNCQCKCPTNDPNNPIQNCQGTPVGSSTSAPVTTTTTTPSGGKITWPNYF